MKLHSGIFLAFVLWAGIAFGQSEPPAYHHVAERIVAAFNNDQFIALPELCAENLKDQLVSARIVKLFKDLKAEQDAILSWEYEYRRGSYAYYKILFARSVWSLRFLLNGENLITSITMMPRLASQTNTVHNLTPMSLPFEGQWHVIWGGDTPEQNRMHLQSNSQKNAFDVNIVDSTGRSYKTTGRTNDDYFAFGRPILAPCDAVVVEAVDGVRDNPPGATNYLHPGGNTVVLQTTNGEYIYLTHLRQYSLMVTEGDEVRRGQLVASCGNSGNSSEPQLHMNLQNSDLSTATGIKCYFDSIVVGGTLLRNYSPVRGDEIQNPR
ncbi:MAG: M23 family metallopeptidase [Bacteroidetes bacterium]|nr:M23 family metallopeptidase [Bacteroidota bacterium]